MRPVEAPDATFGSRLAGMLEALVADHARRGKEGELHASPQRAEDAGRPEMTIKEVAEGFGVNRATIYRSLGR